MHACRIALYVGDALLLTGIVEGLKRLPVVYDLHTKLLSLVDGLLDTVNDADEVQAAIPRLNIQMPIIDLPKLPLIDVPSVALPNIEIDLPLMPVLKKLPQAAVKVTIARRLGPPMTLSRCAGCFERTYRSEDCPLLPQVISEHDEDERQTAQLEGSKWSGDPDEAATRRFDSRKVTALTVSLISLVCALAFWTVVLVHLRVRVALWLE